MPPEYIAALKAFAFQSGVSLAEYVRNMVHDHILERGAGFRERGAGLRALVSAVKAWIITYRECVALAAGLPGKERRAELERLTWEAVKKAHEFIQTEEAAKNAKHRILATLDRIRALINTLEVQIYSVGIAGVQTQKEREELYDTALALLKEALKLAQSEETPENARALIAWS